MGGSGMITCNSNALVETPNDGTRLEYVLAVDSLEGTWFPGDRR